MATAIESPAGDAGQALQLLATARAAAPLYSRKTQAARMLEILTNVARRSTGTADAQLPAESRELPGKQPPIQRLCS